MQRINLLDNSIILMNIVENQFFTNDTMSIVLTDDNEIKCVSKTLAESKQGYLEIVNSDEYLNGRWFQKDKLPTKKTNYYVMDGTSISIVSDILKKLAEVNSENYS